jgi:hypothetical protein
MSVETNNQSLLLFLYSSVLAFMAGAFAVRFVSVLRKEYLLKRTFYQNIKRFTQQQQQQQQQQQRPIIN